VAGSCGEGVGLGFGSSGPGWMERAVGRCMRSDGEEGAVAMEGREEAEGSWGEGCEWHFWWMDECGLGEVDCVGCKSGGLMRRFGVEMGRKLCRYWTVE